MNAINEAADSKFQTGAEAEAAGRAAYESDASSALQGSHPLLSGRFEGSRICDLDLSDLTFEARRAAFAIVKIARSCGLYVRYLRERRGRR
jgi:hypothetical protein